MVFCWLLAGRESCAEPLVCAAEAAAAAAAASFCFFWVFLAWPDFFLDYSHTHRHVRFIGDQEPESCGLGHEPWQRSTAARRHVMTLTFAIAFCCLARSIFTKLYQPKRYTHQPVRCDDNVCEFVENTHG